MEVMTRKSTTIYIMMTIKERIANNSLADAQFFVLCLPLTRNNWLYSYGALHFVQFITWMDVKNMRTLHGHAISTFVLLSG
jgi:hypothetical protein